MRRTRRRLAAYLAAFGLVVAPTSGTLHLLLVDHAACLDHGALIHGEHDHAQGEHGHDAGRHGPVAAPRPARHAAHDHGCLLLANLWTQPLPADSDSARVDPGHAPAPAPADVAHRATPFLRPVLAYAPKQSPPSWNAS